MPSNALHLFAGRDIAGTPTPRPQFVAPLLGESVLGIDPSLTGFAICYSVPGRELIEARWSTEPAVTVPDRMERYDKLIRGTLDLVTAHKPGLVLIENYAFEPPGAGKHRGSTHRNELGGVLRWEVWRRVKFLGLQCPIVEVAISSLKKFTTGDGKASKPLMVSQLASKHRRRFATDDAADAFALCQLGLALTGQVPEPSTKAERTYLAGLRKSYALKEVT